MCDTAFGTSLICFKGNNSNLIQINLSSENSTGDSVLSNCDHSEVKKEKSKQKIERKNQEIEKKVLDM